MQEDEWSKVNYTLDFLQEARRLRLLDDASYGRLHKLLEQRFANLKAEEHLYAELRTLAQQPSPTAPPRQSPVPAVPPPPPLVPARPPHPQPVSQRPAPLSPPAGRRSPWLDYGRRVASLIASDFGLHGLAYLGVLLTFAGTFGFVFFSFQEVQRALRPLAEALIPIVFFGSAWFLRRRRAPLVAMGLEVLGGAMLPVVVTASLVDGAPLPRDLTGGVLIAVVTVSLLLLASCYAAWSHRHTGSPLRYLAAPLAWTAAMASGFVFKEGTLVGLAIEHPASIQPALTCAAIAVTLLVSRVRPAGPLVRATRTAAVPSIALAYLLTILLSGPEGWPLTSLVVAGVSVLVVTETLGGSPGLVSIAQPLVLAVTLSPLADAVGAAPTRVVIVLAYLALIERRGLERPQPLGTGLALTGMAVGLVLCMAEPWTTVTGWTAASIWTHARRIVPWSRAGAGLVDDAILATGAAFLPVGAAVGLLLALADGMAWLVLAAAVLLGAAACRSWFRDDPFWAWWIPVAAGLVTLGVVFTWRTGSPVSPGQLAAAAGLAGSALMLAPRWPAVRVWTATAAFALVLALIFEMVGLSPGVRPAAWSLAAVLALVAASLWRASPGGHLDAVAHLAALGALVAPAAGGSRVLVLGCWSVCWLATSVGEVVGRAPLSALLVRATEHFEGAPRTFLQRALALLAPVTFAISFPFVIIRGASLWHVFHEHRSWSGVALALVALLYAGAARRNVRRKPLAPVLAVAAFSVSAVAISVSAPVPWPTIEAVAASIGVVSLMGGVLRRPAMTWFAWAMSGLLVILLANRAGVPVSSINLVSLAWGGVLLLGGLIYDDLRAGRRRSGEGLRVRWLIPPVTIGALAVPLSLGPVFTFGPVAFGWWMLGTSALYLTVARQLRAGAITGVTYALATAGLTALVPWSPLARPWIFVPWAAVLVAISWILGRVFRSTEPWLRWDLAPLLVAHGVVALALVRSTDVGSVTPTWVGSGLLFLAVARLRQRWAWAVAGTAAVLVGAGAAGPTWLAVALVGTSVASSVAAVVSGGRTRTILHGVGLAAAGWAWVETIIAAGWPAADAVAATSVASGTVGLAVGTLARFRRLGSEWVAGWGGLATIGILAAGAGPRAIESLLPAAGTALFAMGAALAARPMQWPWLPGLTALSAGLAWSQTAIGGRWTVTRSAATTALVSGALALSACSAVRLKKLTKAWTLAWTALAVVGMTAALGLAGFSDAERAVVWPALSAGLALTALASALAARPLELDWLRESTAVLALASGWALIYGLDPPGSQQVLATAAAGLVATFGSVVLWRRNASSHWLRPLAIFGVTASVASIPLGTAGLPDRGPLIAALLVTGTESAAAGITLRRVEPLYVSPFLLCAAWIVFASEALTGNPQWFTAPVGLTLLVVVEIGRWGRRQDSLRPVTPELLAIELLGIAFLVGASLVQIFTMSPACGFLAVGLGAGLMGWGGYTRVRRRAAAGALVSLLAVLLMLAAPIVGSIDEIRGATLWISLASVGAILIVVTTLLEQGRARAKVAARRLAHLMEGWE